MRIIVKVLAGLSTLTLFHAGSANAEVILLDRDNGSPIFNDLKIQIGGSIRAGYRNVMGGNDDGSYRHRGFDDGSRFRFTAEYFLNDDLNLIAYYEPGVDIFRALDWDDHYDPDRNHTTRRYLYGGIVSQQYGTLTYGKQNSVFYSAVGEKTDLILNAMNGQGPGNGVDGNYDGSYRGRDLVKYVNEFGPVTLHLGWTLPTDDYYLGGSGDDLLRYTRKGGGAIGAEYQLNDDLVLSAAYSYTEARVRQGSQDSTDYDQQMLGGAVSWRPGNWTLAALAGHYRDFLPLERRTPVPSDYFEGDAYGWEYFLGYTFPLQTGILKSTQPYVAGNAMRWDEYQTNYHFVGLSTKMAYGFRVDLERTLANTSDGQPDENWVRLRYDF
ncbi:porin [Halotalea alkalilenta]|uniref:Porin domain-containing protein n=1 Tax=Halotalea alkalilenta TaxID=376489 RepID=A0A172YBM8_9GAMM|nr:porin [Halotalea alkalilenta]ANF56649.1 hypothetical protein A5892_03540 [Halotalea alkalilenta]